MSQILSNLSLDALSAGDCEVARGWRNQHRGNLRTPYPLTQWAQTLFYRDVVSARDAAHRYYAVRLHPQGWADHTGVYVPPAEFVAMVGLVGVSLENGTGEISLIVDPGRHRQGIGQTAVALVLEEAFTRLRLDTVWGEVYDHNPAVTFWRKVVEAHSGHWATLPGMKFWDGQRYASHFFCIQRPAS